jgi:hypothetical protein
VAKRAHDNAEFGGFDFVVAVAVVEAEGLPDLLALLRRQLLDVSRLLRRRRDWPRGGAAARARTSCRFRHFFPSSTKWSC